MTYNFSKYHQDLPYSYVFGAFGTIELLKNKPQFCKAILVDSSFKESPTFSKLQELTKNHNIPLIIDNNLLNKIKDKDNIFVIGVFKKYQVSLSNNKHLVLYNIEDYGEIGTIIRSMRGFNFENLVLINCHIDVFNEHLIRSTMGAFFGVNIQTFKTLDDYISIYPNNIFYQITTDGLPLKSIKNNDNISLVFANNPLNNSHLINIKFTKNISLDNIINIVLFNIYD